MISLELDHVVVVAPNLDDGCAWVAEHLGASPSGGGRHDRMGTHNRVLRLGQRAYLEVISIDPEGTPPERPRWFGLDELPTAFPPFLGAWVARTTDLASAVTVYPQAGTPQPMSRGHMHWQIAIPEDGRSPAGGAGPWLIQWPDSFHPAPFVVDHGLAIDGLVVTYPNALDLPDVWWPPSIAGVQFRHGQRVGLELRLTNGRSLGAC